MPAMIARVPAPNLASCFCLIEDVMRPKLEWDGPGPRLASAGSVSKWRSTRRWRSVHRGEQLARVTQTRRLTDFPSVSRNELRSHPPESNRRPTDYEARSGR